MADEMDKFFELNTPSGQAAVRRERVKLLIEQHIQEAKDRAMLDYLKDALLERE